MVYPHNEILFSIKGITSDTQNNVDRFQKHYAKQKQSNLDGYTLYDSMTFRQT